LGVWTALAVPRVRGGVGHGLTTPTFSSPDGEVCPPPADATASPAPVGVACSATVETVQGAPVDLRPPLSTMTARPAPQLPDVEHCDRYAFEPKLDGWLN
jgi:hypothetical protein